MMLKKKEEIKIPINHIPKGSHIYVNVKCDICGKESKTQYRRCFDGYICNYCSSKKSNLENWGYENPFQSEGIRFTQ